MYKLWVFEIIVDDYKMEYLLLIFYFFYEYELFKVVCFVRNYW